MNSEYMTIPQYIECKSKLIGKIQTYDLLIEKLEGVLDEALASGSLSEIEVDDSMMRVRSRYRSIKELESALNGFIQRRQYYINKHNGRVTVLRGGNL